MLQAHLPTNYSQVVPVERKMNQMHFGYSLIIAVVVIINSSHQLTEKHESELIDFYSNILQKLDEIKQFTEEYETSFRKALSEQSNAIQQIKQKQSEIEQALSRNLQGIRLLVDSFQLQLGQQLISAVKNGDIKQVNFLLELGAPIEYQDSEKNRPIHVAVRNRHPQILEALLKNKPDIESKGIYEQTALIMAGFSNCVACARILLEKGADIGSRDQWGNTPIVGPARVGYKEFIELLLARGADINESQNDGITGLHWAARDGQLPIVMFLVEKGANVKLKTLAGQTPIDEAVANHHPLVAEFLRSVSKNN